MESSKVRLFSTFSAEYKAIYVSHFSQKVSFPLFLLFASIPTRTVRPFHRPSVVYITGWAAFNVSRKTFEKFATHNEMVGHGRSWSSTAMRLRPNATTPSRFRGADLCYFNRLVFLMKTICIIIVSQLCIWLYIYIKYKVSLKRKS